MAYVIQLLSARPTRHRLELGESIVVGRSKDADLTIDDKLISRRHCELSAADDGVRVEDLKSRNGTSLNGHKFRGEVLARPGDQIRVGSHYLLIERSGGEGARSGTTGRRRTSSRARRDPSADSTPTTAIAIPRFPGLPGFEIVERLGAGEIGSVYRARALLDRREVAIKILDKRASELAVKRFTRSARALRQLDHPNIVRVLEVGEVGKVHFLSMELLRGRTLADMIAQQPLSVREALAVVAQVARALKLAHEKGVIHRDVCPRNIFVQAGGVAKLLGFSFVKSAASDAEGSLTNLGDIVGDLCYSSPEQARDPRSVEPTSDLYALGAVLFHALTGAPPFTGNNHLEVLRKVLSSRAPSLEEHAPHAPTSLALVVDRLMEKEPALRYPDAEAVERALEDVLLEVCGGKPAESGDDSHSFGGGFSGAELLEIVQFLELHQKSGRLVVSAPPLEGEIVLREGAIAHAQAGQLMGSEAALALLDVEAGTFRFVAQSRPGAGPATPLRLRPSVLAIEVMRKRDERDSRR